MKETKILTAGDSSLLIQFGQEISPEINAQITAFVHLMREQHLEGVTDVIPAFTSLLINYDPRVIDYTQIKTTVLEKLLKLGSQQKRLLLPYFCKFRYATAGNTARIWKILQNMQTLPHRKSLLFIHPVTI